MTIRFIWDAEDCVMRVHPHFRTIARNAYIHSEEYTLESVDDRDMDFHRAYMAAVAKAWSTLPEDKEKRFPRPTLLRQWALIRVGYYREKTFTCDSPAFAKSLAAQMGRREADEDYAIVKIDGDIVRVFTARSQKVGEMKAPEFNDSANKVIELLCETLGVTRNDLFKASKDNA